MCSGERCSPRVHTFEQHAPEEADHALLPAGRGGGKPSGVPRVRNDPGLDSIRCSSGDMGRGMGFVGNLLTPWTRIPDAEAEGAAAPAPAPTTSAA